MMPKLPKFNDMESAVLALGYARAVIEACAKIADTHAVVKAEGPARTACEMAAAAIRNAAKEVGR